VEIATFPSVIRKDRKCFTLTLPSPLKGEGMSKESLLKREEYRKNIHSRRR
jgi:hypothetical protein